MSWLNPHLCYKSVVTLQSSITADLEIKDKNLLVSLIENFPIQCWKWWAACMAKPFKLPNLFSFKSVGLNMEMNGMFYD